MKIGFVTFVNFIVRKSEVYVTPSKVVAYLLCTYNTKALISVKKPFKTDIHIVQKETFCSIVGKKV